MHPGERVRQEVGQAPAGVVLGGRQKLVKALDLKESSVVGSRGLKNSRKLAVEPELASCPNGRLSLSLSPLVLYCISYS